MIFAMLLNEHVLQKKEDILYIDWYRIRELENQRIKDVRGIW